MVLLGLVGEIIEAPTHFYKGNSTTPHERTNIEKTLWCGGVELMLRKESRAEQQTDKRKMGKDCVGDLWIDLNLMSIVVFMESHKKIATTLKTHRFHEHIEIEDLRKHNESKLNCNP